MTILKNGDSSKPISVYANGDVTNPALRSNAGLKINIGKFNISLNLGLENISVGVSVDEGEKAAGYYIKANLSTLKIGFEQTISKTERNETSSYTMTEFSNYSVTGIGIALVVMYLLSGGQMVPSPAPA